MQDRPGRAARGARDPSGAGGPRPAGRVRYLRRRGRVPAHRRARARADGRLLHADRRRTARLRPDRGRQRPVGRVRDGGAAADGAQPGGVLARAARAARCWPRSWPAARRSPRQAGVADRRRPLDRRSGAEVRDGGDGRGSPRPRRAQLDRPAGRRAVPDEADRRRRCHHGGQAGHRGRRRSCARARR